MEKADMTVNYFYNELCKRVTATNAKLLLQNAVSRSGLPGNLDHALNKEEAQALCLELIRIGGPGFHVGRAVYTRMVQ